MRKSVGERLTGNVDAQNLRRNPAHQLLGQAGLETFRLESGVAHGLAAERVETSREVAVHAMGLDQGHRSRDSPEEKRWCFGRPGGCGGRAVAVHGTGVELPDALDDRARRHEPFRSLLEKSAPGRIDRLGRHEVLREEFLDEP